MILSVRTAGPAPPRSGLGLLVRSVSLIGAPDGPVASSRLPRPGALADRATPPDGIAAPESADNDPPSPDDVCAAEPSSVKNYKNTADMTSDEDEGLPNSGLGVIDGFEVTDMNESAAQQKEDKELVPFETDLLSISANRLVRHCLDLVSLLRSFKKFSQLRQEKIAQILIERLKP